MQLAIQNFLTQKYFIQAPIRGENKQIYGLSLSPQLNSDKVCFTGENAEFLKLPRREIYKKINDSIDNSNLLGYGTEGSVYAIPGTDYCLKYSRYRDSRTTLNKNFTLKVSQQDKVNHIVARLGNDAVIMKHLKGVTVSELNRYTFGVGVDENIYRLLSFPNSAYRDYLLQIVDALNYGMEYDAHGGNLMVDFDAKTLTALDFFPPQRMINEQPLSKVYYPFLSINNISSKLEVAFARKIFDMLLDEFKPHTEQKLDFNKVDELLFLCDLYNDNILQIKPKQISQIHELFENLKSLKEAEMSGVDVCKQLTKTISDLEKLLDKCLPHIDSGSNM